jgi:hypothetical protein
MGEIIIALAIVGLMFFLMRRGGMGCCGGHSHGHRTGNHKYDKQQEEGTTKGGH